MILNIVRGFLMALADSVPGVSGGTIAYLMGFFDKFIYSLNYLMKGTKQQRCTSAKFLAKIGIGWVIGMGLSVTILATLFDKGIYKMSSLFLGFIIAAIPVMIVEEKEYIKGRYKNLVWALLGGAAVFILSALKFGKNIDLSNLNLSMILYIFIAGALAVSAMVLPGISGSTLMLAFGLYIPVITGIKNLIHFDFSDFLLLFIFGLGILNGIFTSLRGIKKLLEKNRSAMVYAILGMMIASLYAIVTGPATLKVPQPAMSLKTFDIIFFCIGVLLTLGFQLLKKLPVYNKETAV